MDKYIAKPGTWFKEGTEVELVSDCRPLLSMGIFRGTRVSAGSPELHPIGEEYMDEEDCNFAEFEVTHG